MLTVAALAAGAALALTGCSAGQIAQTADQVPAVNGNESTIGQIALRNLHIVYPAAGAEYTNAKGGKALIALSIINDSPSVSDELTSVTTELGTVKITPASGKSTLELAPQQTVVATNDAAKAGSAGQSAPTTAQAAEGEEVTAPEAKPALIEINDLSKDITPGLTYRLTFNFKQNGTGQVEVPVDAGTAPARVGSAVEAEHGSGH
ncbi:hypothetical protein [Nocardia callitridis]|uniref:Lipoprotein LpqE n=1 Tax=Nocardia callitridis TaxID=648753 RepID=A0ABP9K220_9NOCA